ncbi:unnamed protein product [Callosobruchus maculatus]|uniref:Uncharacterized protein n=1 Tax=Callosobruchus maculatus TaxID=64391 RepID=A0A653CN09_CALMS|nr:unnamed protein product [Callosobruchus maculatus]
MPHTLLLTSVYLVAYLRFNPIENIQTGSTNSIARMNFVWTRERSERSNATASENGCAPVFRTFLSLRFSVFLCYDNLREAIKQPGGSSKKLDCCPPGGSSKKLDCVHQSRKRLSL